MLSNRLAHGSSLPKTPQTAHASLSDQIDLLCTQQNRLGDAQHVAFLTTRLSFQTLTTLSDEPRLVTRSQVCPGAPRETYSHLRVFTFSLMCVQFPRLDSPGTPMVEP